MDSDGGETTAQADKPPKDDLSRTLMDERRNILGSDHEYVGRRPEEGHLLATCPPLPLPHCCWDAAWVIGGALCPAQNANRCGSFALAVGAARRVGKRG